VRTFRSASIDLGQLKERPRSIHDSFHRQRGANWDLAARERLTAGVTCRPEGAIGGVDRSLKLSHAHVVLRPSASPDSSVERQRPRVQRCRPSAESFCQHFNNRYGEQTNFIAISAHVFCYMREPGHRGRRSGPSPRFDRADIRRVHVQITSLRHRHVFFRVVLSVVPRHADDNAPSPVEEMAQAARDSAESEQPRRVLDLCTFQSAASGLPSWLAFRHRHLPCAIQSKLIFRSAWFSLMNCATR
jgi:hypothetical protein